MNKKTYLTPFVFVLTATVVFALVNFPAQSRKQHERTLELVETVKVNVPDKVKEVKLWIPKPPSDSFQTVELLNINSAWSHELTKDSDFGNETLFLRAQSPKMHTAEVKLLYRITRQEQKPLKLLESASPLYLTPRSLLVVNSQIRQIAQETTKGIHDPYEKAKSLYQYVLNHMAYDKSGWGWGQGDSVYACIIGKGNCTDFHSLFMALAIASDIPVRFRMGYIVPKDAQGILPQGYHCWAEFYATGKGWIPVDISEAWKNRSLSNYYFGSLDENRVLVSTGRGIRLSPPQKGPPLNFLYQPYVEIDGKPLNSIEYKRSYREIPPKV